MTPLCTAKPTPRKGPKKTLREVLTRKALSAKLALHSMKTTTKQRVKAIAIGLLIAAAIVAQGLLETNPNH